MHKTAFQKLAMALVEAAGSPYMPQPVTSHGDSMNRLSQKGRRKRARWVR